jgi:hypothetical protein
MVVPKKDIGIGKSGIYIRAASPPRSTLKISGLLVLNDCQVCRLQTSFADYTTRYWVEIVSTTVSQGSGFLKPPLPIKFTQKGLTLTRRDGRRKERLEKMLTTYVTTETHDMAL